MSPSSVCTPSIDSECLDDYDAVYYSDQDNFGWYPLEVIDNPSIYQNTITYTSFQGVQGRVPFNGESSFLRTSNIVLNPGTGTYVMAYGWWLGPGNATFTISGTPTLSIEHNTTDVSPEVFSEFSPDSLSALHQSTLLFSSQPLPLGQHVLNFTNFGSLLAVDYFEVFLNSSTMTTSIGPSSTTATTSTRT